MTQGNGPPDPGVPQALFNTLHALSYSATHLAFTDTSGAFYFLFVEPKTGGSTDQAQWFCGTDTDGQTSPKGLIPQLTATVVASGTYNATDGTISYNTKKYRISLQRDITTGNQYALAITV